MNFGATAIFWLATQAITIKWLRADLCKHEDRHEKYVEDHSLVTKDVREDINSLNERTNHILKREEIESVVRHEVRPMNTTLTSMTTTINDLSKNVTQLSVDIAVLGAMRARDLHEDILGKHKDAYNTPK